MNDMENKISSVSHDVAQARAALEKALCALAAHSNTDYSKLLEIAQDYIMEANSKWLHSAEHQLEALPVPMEKVGQL